MIPGMFSRVRPVILLAALGAAPLAAAAPGSEGRETRLEGGLTAIEPAPALSERPSAATVDVRRWEYVILLRTSPEVKDALGRAEVAALAAGGAVLDDLEVERTASHQDHRILVRTRDRDAIHQVVRAMRSSRGVLGATATPLPETPTYPGGPGFFESYSAGIGDSPGNADRVVVRHDVPPIADKKELLEMSDVLAPPSSGPDGPGGFTLNVSELFSRMKEGMWRRREERLRNTPIEILPPAPAAEAAPSGP